MNSQHHLENLADFPVATPHSEAVHIMECLRAITTLTVEENKGEHCIQVSEIGFYSTPALFRQVLTGCGFCSIKDTSNRAHRRNTRSVLYLGLNLVQRPFRSHS